MNPQETVERLAWILGWKMVAYIAGVTDVANVREWAEKNEVPDPEVLHRLELALKYAVKVWAKNGKQVTAAWFSGLKDAELPHGSSPARFLREGHLPDLQAKIESCFQNCVRLGVIF